MSSDRVIYNPSRDLWVYEDSGEPATLADTMASLQRRNLMAKPRRTRQFGTRGMTND
jgi:hypothetical protein